DRSWKKLHQVRQVNLSAWVSPSIAQYVQGSNPGLMKARRASAETRSRTAKKSAREVQQMALDYYHAKRIVTKPDVVEYLLGRTSYKRSTLDKTIRGIKELARNGIKKIPRG